MKRAFGVLLVIALFLFPFNAFAVVKAGTACSKAGTTATANGKKFTCIKSGKKLVWNKGVTVVPAKSSTPAAPTSFSDLEANYSGVPYWAWKKSGDVLAVSKPKNAQLTILIGPNSHPVYEIPQVAISQVSRLFPNYQESKELDKYQLIEGDIIIALTGGTIAKLAIVQAGLGKIYLNQRLQSFFVYIY